MELGKEYFGPLWSFVASNEITDIDYNGKEIWLTNIFNERFRANQQFVTQYMTPAFVEQFTQRIANVVSRQFNKRNPELEAETSDASCERYCMNRLRSRAGASAYERHRRLSD